MTWVVIVLIFIVAFGPVMWLLPSKRDRRLSALRQRARTEGITVDLRRLPKLDASPAERVSAGGKVRKPVLECAAYLVSLPRKLTRLPKARYLRASDGPHVWPGWILETDSVSDRTHLKRLESVLERYVSGAAEDVVAVEVEQRAFACYWLESPGSDVEMVTNMARNMEALADELAREDDRIEAEDMVDDS